MKTQRLKLDIDLSTNELFCNEVESFIKGAVKSITRDGFRKEITAEVERLAEKRVKELTQKGGPSNYTLRASINEVTHLAVAKAVDELVLEMAKEKIEMRLEGIDTVIEKAVTERVNSLKVPEFVSDYTSRRVNEALTNELLKALLIRMGDMTVSDFNIGGDKS